MICMFCLISVWCIENLWNKDPHGLEIKKNKQTNKQTKIKTNKQKKKNKRMKEKRKKLLCPREDYDPFLLSLIAKGKMNLLLFQCVTGIFPQAHPWTFMGGNFIIYRSLCFKARFINQSINSFNICKPMFIIFSKILRIWQVIYHYVNCKIFQILLHCQN